jgi:hypothetical protein
MVAAWPPTPGRHTRILFQGVHFVHARDGSPCYHNQPALRRKEVDLGPEDQWENNDNPSFTPIIEEACFDEIASQPPETGPGELRIGDSDLVHRFSKSMSPTTKS